MIELKSNQRFWMSNRDIPTTFQPAMEKTKSRFQSRNIRLPIVVSKFWRGKVTTSLRHAPTPILSVKVRIILTAAAGMMQLLLTAETTLFTAEQVMTIFWAGPVTITLMGKMVSIKFAVKLATTPCTAAIKMILYLANRATTP